MLDQDYTESDRWDWDHEDPRQYCRHGSFIGSWWGPDILCSHCEMGDDPTMNEMISSEWHKLDKMKIKMGATVDFAIKIIAGVDQESKAIVSELLVEAINASNEETDRINTVIQHLKDSYGPFSEDWETDREVLYRKHRAEIKLFDDMRKEQ